MSHNSIDQLLVIMLLRLTIVAVAVFVVVTEAAKLEDVFQWNELSFNWPDEMTKDAAIKSGKYVPENNLPLGLGRWHDKLFVTVPRWVECFFYSIREMEKSTGIIRKIDFEEQEHAISFANNWKMKKFDESYFFSENWWRKKTLHFQNFLPFQELHRYVSYFVIPYFVLDFF